MIEWSTCKDHFEADGSLRDIYIVPATIEDWGVIYLSVLSQPGVEYYVDGVALPRPDSVEQVFQVRRSSSPMLRFRVGRSLLVFHFFCEEEIECDFNPGEITSQDDLNELLNFVRALGDAIHKPVIITPENRLNQPFITYCPDIRRFEHHLRPFLH